MANTASELKKDIISILLKDYIKLVIIYNVIASILSLALTLCIRYLRGYSTQTHFFIIEILLTTYIKICVPIVIRTYRSRLR